MTMTLVHDLKASAARLDRALADYLAETPLSGPGPAPERLVAAMRHGSLNGGKRLRPYLVETSAALFGISPHQATRTGLALEMVHCYSLIHDDLPAMDDDDLRRGQPTVHRAFDEATAILAGDALLTHAFAVLGDPATHPDPSIRIRLVAELAAGSGAGGMAGGQMLDILGESSPLTETEILSMQAMKTGALIRAAVRMGAMLGGASDRDLAALTAYAEAAGRAFQLADDILDVTASAEAMGKATGKDADQGKQTLVGILGLDAARLRLDAMVAEAIAALTPLGPNADRLRAIARYFAARET
jgi:farnesyl diphosphate synthase